ncbi:MAG: hypothetical protein UX10_C0022G0009 [Candidatus Magasanikbacteria bacterium GW2011_GWA2_45_39]|uniref:Uncharacterized protein n=2 Tax=Candidatus Magasanikiibacteriota TaxID=1752731 RepID=A0A0G1Q846_9BACT|nr:MAG: hypothetical protein UX10_C0022G0009 [Candidatus Magasanikbacteria bacterium GW2011_GWA2_45_39]KKU13918.1 MAG: hypothetical protein UX20_C0010G0010 [Candidatus Magasanikbacteria bacterium GW2011_GWC2_45_8]
MNMDHKDFLNIPGTQDEELSSGQLKIGFWIAEHLVVLRKTGVALFIVFDVVLGGYNIYHWATYFLSGYFNDQKSAVELVNTTNALNQLVSARAAAPLVIKGTTAYESATGRFDAIALVQNTNKEWYVSFDYEFDLGNGKTLKEHGFLLPEEEKPVGIFNVEGLYSASEPSFHLSNIVWKRISKHDIADVTTWLAARKKFDTLNLLVTSAGSLVLAEGRLDFDIINQSFYDYRDPEFLIGVWNGPTLARVYKIHVPRFTAGEMRHIELAAPSSMLSGAQIKLYPHIDFFDSSVYLK